MARFQHMLWGYRLDYPDEWSHRSLQDVEGFAASPQALEPDADGPGSGHMLIQSEWNGMRLPVDPVWEAHIAKVAAMAGAHRVGSAPWAMGGGSGYEAEIVLPKRADKRLWVGVLARELVLLKIMVAHPKEDRPWFEPLVTASLKSLLFLDRAEGVPLHETGIPLPPGCQEIDPTEALIDLPDPNAWRVFESPHSFVSLHAFYAREAPAHGWLIESFESFPNERDPGFSRVRLSKEGRALALGLLPYRRDLEPPVWLGRIAVKLG
jgi:hypothetical protein